MNALRFNNTVLDMIIVHERNGTLKETKKVTYIKKGSRSESVFCTFISQWLSTLFINAIKFCINIYYSFMQKRNTQVREKQLCIIYLHWC